MRSQQTKILILLCSLAFFWSCATDTKKASPVAIKVSQIKKNLSSLSVSYGKKDEKGFLDGFDPASDALPLIRTHIVGDFERFSSAKISFIVDRVELEDGRIKTVVRWKGAWIQKSGTPPLEKRGKAIFFWDDASDPKMIEVRGDSPFGVFRSFSIN